MAPEAHVLRAADRTPRRWKNGGGLTTEIAAHPVGATLDAFDWRVSTADVATDGPFSRFTGIDRTLAVLDGAGVTLELDGAAPVRLTCQSAPFAFAADRPCQARLVDGPITDLNVMTRRTTWRHAVQRIEIVGRFTRATSASPWLVYCQSGSVRVSTAARVHEIGAKDAVLSGEGHIDLTATSPSSVYIVEFHRR